MIATSFTDCQDQKALHGPLALRLPSRRAAEPQRHAVPVDGGSAARRICPSQGIGIFHSISIDRRRPEASRSMPLPMALVTSTTAYARASDCLAVGSLGRPRELSGTTLMVGGAAASRRSLTNDTDTLDHDMDVDRQ